PRLIVEIRAGLTRGARDIRFRDSTLSAQDVKTLRELAARFGFERVRIRDDGPPRVRVAFHEPDAARDGAASPPRRKSRARGPAGSRRRAQRPGRAHRPRGPGRPVGTSLSPLRADPRNVASPRTTPRVSARADRPS